MKTFAFQLGHQPIISRAEIFSVLNVYNIVYKIVSDQTQILFLQIEIDFPVIKLIKILGGTIKIMEDLELPNSGEKTIADYLTTVVKTGKIDFSISGNNAEHLAISVKKNLKARDRLARYIAPKNTATILHNGLVESASDLTIFQNKIFVTRAIQSIEEFSERDYGRPNSDSKSGMLPPKLARMMINLAGIPLNKTLLDPFCGSGTILLEAIDLGFFHLIGSDISKKAIDDSTKNVHWYIQKNKITTEPKLILSDIHTLGQKLQPKSVDAIVSEPYMGNPLRGHEPKEQITKITIELRQLYEDAFKTFSPIIKLGGTIIFIIPEFYVNNKVFTVDCLSHIRKLGFKVVPLDSTSDSLLYRRPGQFVGRRIWKFSL